MVLEALFNGGIYASENVVPKSDSFRQATEEIARIMTFFEGKLPPEDYALLEKLCDRHADEGNITNEVQVWVHNGRSADVRNLPQPILPSYRLREKYWMI